MAPMDEIEEFEWVDVVRGFLITILGGFQIVWPEEVQRPVCTVVKESFGVTDKTSVLYVKSSLLPRSLHDFAARMALMEDDWMRRTFQVNVAAL